MLGHIELLFFWGVLIIHGGCPLKSELLSTLEYSLTETESTKCDLVFLGQDLPLDEETTSQRLRILNTNGSKDMESAIMKFVLAMAKCLLLFINEVDFPFTEMMHLAGKIQRIKPLGVVYQVKNEGEIFSALIDRRRWPFPIIFQLFNSKT